MAKAVGLPDGTKTRWLLRLIGARELAGGLGILGTRRPTRWLSSRIAGDGVDLALLGGLLSMDVARGRRLRIAGTLAAVAGVTALDVAARRRLARAESKGLPTTLGDPVVVSGAITVSKPPADVYAFWRNFENLPRFMANVSDVAVADAIHSRWTVNVAGKTVEWQAEITDERAPERIAWRTRAASDVFHRGEVRFVGAPRGQGTEVHVEIVVTPPGGWFGGAAARMARVVSQEQVAFDLRRLKQVLEIGEVMRSDASIHNGPHPARPAARHERVEERGQ